MSEAPFACVVLAAGNGKRMKSDLPKVLHRVAGTPMVSLVTQAATAAGAARCVVVVGPGMDNVAATVAPHATALQADRRGTGDAVRCAMPHLEGFSGDIVVLFGDTPLVTPETVQQLASRLHEPDRPAVAVLGMQPADPGAYGRLVRDDDGDLKAIVEFADATDTQRAIGLCNGGLMAFAGAHVADLLADLTDDNRQGEIYLTDTVTSANARGLGAAVVDAEEVEVMGVNTRAQLAAAESAMQDRLRRRAMDAGVTLVDPATTYLAADTRFGRDVVVHPMVVFHQGVAVGDGAEIHSFCHLEKAQIGPGAQIGPFARLRPGAEVGERAKVGNFVEMKNAALGTGAKANHLTYLGDTEVGPKANIGAGTITCNYDGFKKYKTKIGADAFIGSNTALVAPVTIGDGAIVGAGSVITKPVDNGALAVSRAQQIERPKWADKLRAVRAAEKRAKPA